MSIEAMKMALEFVEWLCSDDHSVKPKNSALKTREALRQAIEQAQKQEPYGYLWFTHHMERRFTHYKPKEEQHIGDVTPVYTAPVHTSDIKQERVDVPDFYEPIWSVDEKGNKELVPRANRVPPKREWVGLTVEEARKFYEKYTNREELIYAIDEFLEEKNT